MRRALTLSIILLCCLETRAQGPPCSTTAAVEALILDHVARYPAMAVQDLYKLLHQASLGSEHAVTDTTAARRWLDRESAALGPGPGEPVFDTLGAEGGYVRVHLRPYLEAGGRPAPLLAAFIATGAQTPPDAASLACAQRVAVRLARDGALPWTAEEVESYFSEQAERRYPAVHHSPGFVAQYRPAYRVVSQVLLHTLGVVLE